MFWYPNDTGMAPISLAITLAQPSSVSNYYNAHVRIRISVTSDQVKQFSINGLMIAGAAFDAAVDDAEVGDLFQAISQLSPQLGTMFTFTTNGEVTESNATEADIPTITDDIGQLYMVGQAALVNWTEYQIFSAPPVYQNTTVGWYLGLQLTEFKAVENKSAVAPMIYYWSAYDPCVNLSAWAWEQQALMQDPYYLFDSGTNYWCPLPNTPAPVIWQDYATKLTHYANVSPYNLNFQIYYVDLSVNGGESPLGIDIDAGSAIAWTIGAALMASQPEIGATVEVVGALLGAFQYTTTSVAETANYISVYNQLPYNVNMYYSNLTPVYTVGGQRFTLPRELVLINVTS
jgi:hypothetical protein